MKRLIIALMVLAAGIFLAQIQAPAGIQSRGSENQENKSQQKTETKEMDSHLHGNDKTDEIDSSQPVSAVPDESTKQRIVEGFGKLPIYFIENQGQLDKQVSHYIQGKDKTIYFTKDGLTFVLTPLTASIRPDKLSLSEQTEQIATDAPVQQIMRHVVKLEFLNANPEVEPEGKDKTKAVISYFKGPKDEWQTGLPTYRGLEYSNLWEGIDLRYTGARSQLKYTFYIQPGADPKKIQLAYRGADSLSLTDAGGLTVTTPAGNLHDGAPVAWQEIEGARRDVPVRFALDDQTHTISFSLGDYDRSHPLVLDPAVLVYAGYIGGSSGDDVGYGIAVDGSGNAYVTGVTTSTEATFPVTGGPDLTSNGVNDAFVAKVSADGTTLVYVGYIGGSGSDYGYGIAVDGSGNAYVTGWTTSDETTFPVMVGPDLTHNSGALDAFVAKVNASGTALVYAGYIGGSGWDEGYGIAVDGSGNAYVTGRTESPEATFPVTVGPDLTFNGGADAFVAKVSADGTILVYAGYIGGGGYDWGNGIAVDGSGNAYVTGRTASDETTFPVTVGPDLTYNGGGWDAYVAKVNASGTALVYAGYIGGSDIDYGNGIAVDGSGNAYVAGYTASTEATFPVTVGPDLTYNGGTNDAYVAKVNPSGTAIVFAGYIGGSSTDWGYGIAVDGSGNAYVTGLTESGEATFPVTVGPDLTYNGGSHDAYVAKVNASGTAIVYAGYIGGSGNEWGYGIVVDGSGNVYVTGYTTSTEATFPVTVGPDLTYNGGNYDAFVAKITETATASSADLSVTKTDSPDPVTVGNNLTYTITITNNGPNAATGVTLTDALPSGVTFVSSSASQGSCSGTSTVTCTIGSLANGATATVTIVVTPTAAGSITNTASVTATETDSNSANNSATQDTTVSSASSGDSGSGGGSQDNTQVSSSDSGGGGGCGGSINSSSQSKDKNSQPPVSGAMMLLLPAAWLLFRKTMKKMIKVQEMQNRWV